jgi:hypothetical protein
VNNGAGSSASPALCSPQVERFTAMDCLSTPTRGTGRAPLSSSIGLLLEWRIDEASQEYLHDESLDLFLVMHCSSC